MNKSTGSGGTLFSRPLSNPWLIASIAMGVGLVFVWLFHGNNVWMSGYLGYVLCIPLTAFILLVAVELVRYVSYLALMRSTASGTDPPTLAPLSVTGCMVVLGIATAAQMFNVFQRLVAGGLWRYVSPWLAAHSGQQFDRLDVVTMGVSVTLFAVVVFRAQQRAAVLAAAARPWRSWRTSAALAMMATVATTGAVGASSAEGPRVVIHGSLGVVSGPRVACGSTKPAVPASPQSVPGSCNIMRG